MNAIGLRADGALWSTLLLLGTYWQSYVFWRLKLNAPPSLAVTIINAAVLKHRLDDASNNPNRSRCMSLCIYANYLAHLIATIFYILLLIGTIS